MKLNTDGLAYLLHVAREVGFNMMEMDTHESINAAPIVTIKFLQKWERPTATAAPVEEPISTTTAPGWMPKIKADELKTLDE